MARRSLLSLSGSLLLHGLAVGAAIVLVARESAPPALIIELKEAIRVGDRSLPGAGGDSRPAAVHRAPLRAATHASGTGTRPAPVRPRPPTPEPAVQPEPSAGPPALAMAEHSDRSAVAAPPQSPLVAVGGSPVRETDAEGLPGSGPLAMLAPSGKGGEATGASGIGAGGAGIREGIILGEFGPYLARLRQRIQESLQYPLPARRRGLGGTVQLEIELLPTGKVASVVVRSSSSHGVLDQAAVESVSRLEPVPFPPGVPPRPLRVRLPVVFELK